MYMCVLKNTDLYEHLLSWVFFVVFFVVVLVLEPVLRCRTRTVQGPLEIELTSGEKFGRNMLNLGVANCYGFIIFVYQPRVQVPVQTACKPLTVTLDISDSFS